MTRIKLYDTTPNVVAGTDTESDPTEPTLDLYLPAAEMHILENGPHGFGMGTNQNDGTLKEWPDQALRFMARDKWMPVQ